MSINRGVPQETVIGPIIFLQHRTINEIKCVSPSNLLIQSAEVLTLSIPVSPATSHFVDNSSNFNFNFITYHTLVKNT